MNDYSVYCHTSPSGKKYVGISKNPVKRWNSGRGYSKNYRFARAINKYGWDSFRHEILADGLSAEEAQDLEIHLIRQWNLTDFRYGYNLRDGGDGSFSDESRARMSRSRKGNKNCVGRKLSQEQKTRISQSLKEYYSSHPNPMSGKRHTVETIEKLRNRKFSNETRAKMSRNHHDVSGSNNPSAKPVRQLALDGTVIAEYLYAKQAADELSLDLSAIIRCCRGKAKTCGGFRWEYVA